MINSNDQNLETLIGYKEVQLIKELGNPVQSDTIFYSKNIRLLEYQSSLYNTIDLGNKNELIIKEYIWVRDNFNIVFWLELDNDEWSAFDFIIWDQKKISY